MLVTEDFGIVKPSTQMLAKQHYRAVIKDSHGRPVLTSVATYRNRDLSSSVVDSARDAAYSLCKELLLARTALTDKETHAYSVITDAGVVQKAGAGTGSWISADTTIDHKTVMELLRKGWLETTDSRHNRFGKYPVQMAPKYTT